MAAEPVVYCRSCRAVVRPSNRFCPACGELYPTEPADGALAGAGPLQDIAAEIRPLLQTKSRLGAELEGLVQRSADRPLTDEERRQWERAYQRWRDVSFEITLMVDRIHPRAEADRRSGQVQVATPIPPRNPDDRRDPFWNRAP